MSKENIIQLFNTCGILVKEIENASNSYNSKVYIVKDIDENKYVLKISMNQEKRINECKYYNYLSEYVPTSKVLYSDTVDGNEVNIITFFEGKNIYDEDCNSLSQEEIFQIGELLAKIQSCKPLNDEKDFWYHYLLTRLEKCNTELFKVLGEEDNKIIFNFMKQYIEKNIKNHYQNSLLHMDFRVGNIIFGDNHQVGIIDLESMKSGEYVYDFVKMNRIFSKENFQVFLKGYTSIKAVSEDFDTKLQFYSLYDAYSSLYWCIIKEQLDCEFFRTNYSIVQNALKQIKDGQWII